MPASKVAGTDPAEVVVLDVDATIVVAHSEKEQASSTFKTFGFHPLGVWCDNTTEFLAGMLRTGKAGSNTAADHIEVLTDAIAQLPAAHRRKLLIRSDGAGASQRPTATGTKPSSPTTQGRLAFLEARHRSHARVEDRILHAKDTGLVGSPPASSTSTRPG